MTVKHLSPNIFLTLADTDSTLSAIDANYFAALQNSSSISITLPDVAIMSGHSLTFVTTTDVFEAWLSINGPISFGSSSYTLTALSSVTLLSDGTRWWIVANS